MSHDISMRQSTDFLRCSLSEWLKVHLRKSEVCLILMLPLRAAECAPVSIYILIMSRMLQRQACLAVSAGT